MIWWPAISVFNIVLCFNSLSVWTFSRVLQSNNTRDFFLPHLKLNRQTGHYNSIYRKIQGELLIIIYIIIVVILKIKELSGLI